MGRRPLSGAGSPAQDREGKRREGRGRVRVVSRGYHSLERSQTQDEAKEGGGAVG